MAVSRNRKNHKQKVQKFKKEVMSEQAKHAPKRTHLLPQPEWNSKDMLEVRGDLLEVIDNKIVEAYGALQVVGQAFQQIIGHNVKAGKAKLSYVWNTGEPATEAEVAEYQEMMNKVRELQKQQAEQPQVQSEQQPGAALANSELEATPPAEAEQAPAEQVAETTQEA